MAPPLDDERIRELTEEVLAQLRTPPAGHSADLERRVSALEAAVARLGQGAAGPGAAAPAVHVHAHPALQVLNVPGGGDRCVLEPDKPCVQSLACRVLGH